MVKLLFLDTETTGVDPVKNGIIQLSAIMDIDSACVSEFNTLIRPWDGCVIEDEALAVSGITREQIAAAPDEATAYAQFTAWMGQYISKFEKADKAFMVGYNVGFDDQFLRALAARVGDRFLGSFKWPDVIDVRGMAALELMKVRATMPNFKLETVAEKVLGADFAGEILKEAGLHNAIGDIRLARAVFYEVRQPSNNF